jgi:hypothetical protein
MTLPIVKVAGLVAALLLLALFAFAILVLALVGVILIALAGGHLSLLFFAFLIVIGVLTTIALVGAVIVGEVRNL